MVTNASFLNVIFKIVFFFLRRIHKVTFISRYRSTPDEFKFKTASIINVTWNNKSLEIFFLISKNDILRSALIILECSNKVMKC